MVFSIDDEKTWRVRPENPVREMGGMDWERCAALHNLIIRKGLTVNGESETGIPSKSWWQRHITSPALEEEWTTRLSPSLKLFLQSALVEGAENFFYYVNDLTYPNRLFQQCHEDEGIMTLYAMTNLNMGGHRDGLNFDQETSLAVFQLDIDDFNRTSNGHMVWDPLEVILTAWLDMIDTGKVVVRSPPIRGPHETKPWELLPYSQHDLQTAVNGFDNIILAIECLLENPLLRTKDNPEDQEKLLSLVAAKFDTRRSPEDFGLVSNKVLDTAGIGKGFIRDFLISVRKPKQGIRYIAPGLRIPTAEDFSPHPLQNFEMPECMQVDHPVIPIPLFLTDAKSPIPIMDGYPFQDLTDLPCGLWTNHIDKDSQHVFEDEVRLYLPFEIGAKGFARLGDNSYFGDSLSNLGGLTPKGSRNQLYQPGYNHYVPHHGPQLGDVLGLWQNLVGLGEWEVDEEGIIEGIEKWREADTVESYQDYKYQLGVKW